MRVTFSADAQFYMARDTLLGLNKRTRNAAKGYAILKECVKLPNLSPRLREEAEWMLSDEKKNDTSPRAECFYMLFDFIFGDPDAAIIERASEAGYSLAMALIGNNFYGQFAHHPRLNYVLEASELGEPLGLFLMGCNQHARELGLLQAFFFGIQSWPGSLEHCLWHAAVTLFTEDELDQNIVTDFVSVINYLWNSGRKTMMFKAGELLHNNCDLVAKLTTSGTSLRIQMIEQYYVDCTNSARRAVQMWALCAKRMGFCKDVRQIVAQNIWTLRIGWNKLK